MTDLAKITAVPLHEWALRAVFRLTADEAVRVASGDSVGQLTAERFVRYEGPHCLQCHALYEPSGSDECTAEVRVEATVEF